MIVPGHRYTFEELRAARADPELAGWQARGYHWQYNLDGSAQLVPWQNVPGTAGRGPRGYVATFDEDPWPLDPIKRRTPQQRVDSLMLKVLEDVKAGRVLTQEKISEIVGQALKEGRIEITGEVVRQVVQHYLEYAEKVNEEAESHKVVRTAPSD